MYICWPNITNITMKMDFPQVDLPTEVLAWTNVTEDILNIYKQSCRLQACIVAICTEGSMKASINLLDYEIRPNDLITLLPGTIIQFRERTEKVCLCFVGFSAHCTGRVNLMKNIGNAYPKLDPDWPWRGKRRALPSASRVPDQKGPGCRSRSRRPH